MPFLHFSLYRYKSLSLFLSFLYFFFKKKKKKKWHQRGMKPRHSKEKSWCHF